MKPKIRKDIAVSQLNSGGLSKNASPLNTGVTQSPLWIIVCAIAAWVSISAKPTTISPSAIRDNVLFMFVATSLTVAVV